MNKRILISFLGVISSLASTVSIAPNTPALAISGAQLPIDEVRLFTDRAAIKRQGPVSLSGGTQLIVVNELPPEIDENSLRVDAGGAGVEILGFYTFTQPRLTWKQEARQQLSEQLRRLNQSRELYERETEGQRKLIEFVDNYRQTLSANFARINGQGNQDAAFLGPTIAMLATREQNAQAQIQNLSEQARELRIQIARLDTRLRELEDQARKETREIHLTIKANTPGEYVLRIDYITLNCGWSPRYQVTKSRPGAFDFAYGASVRQQSGENWDNVKIFLSTSPLDATAEPPASGPLRLTLAGNQGTRYQVTQETKDAGKQLEEKSAAGESGAPEPRPETNDADLVEFAVSQRLSIPSPSGDFRIKLSQKSVPGKVTYSVIPRKKTTVFRFWQGENPGGMPLLPGKADLLSRNGFIGSVQLEYTPAGGQWRIATGMEQNIRVEYQEIPLSGDANILGTRKTVTKAWRTTIASYRKQPVTLEIRDQVPVSLVEGFEVTIDREKTTPWKSHKAETGILRWELRLEPGQKTKTDLQYQVTMPADYQGGF